MNDGIRNIGIVAHVDAGKTTLTEQLLFKTSAIRKAGRVDCGTAHTDWMDVEKERGISVRSAVTSIRWNDVTVNIIDTPGHTDFACEVERSLRVLDSAILVVSAVDGIQAHTETLWNTLNSLNIPVIIAINKIDRVGADYKAVISTLRSEFRKNFIPLFSVKNEETENVSLTPLFSKDYVEPQLLETIVENDEKLLNLYLEGKEIPLRDLKTALAQSCTRRDIIPVIPTSAIKDKGITELLDSITELLPEPSGTVEKPVSGVVFSVNTYKQFGKVAAVRLFSGHLTSRDSVKINGGEPEKISQIKRIDGPKLHDIDSISAGEIAAICGIRSIKAGDIIGDASKVPETVSIGTSVLRSQVLPSDASKLRELAAALTTLSDEDPALNFEWFKEEKQLFINIMGKIQIEILEHQLKNRFSIDAQFKNPEVIYLETPSQTGQGYAEYTMPKPCWAVMTLLIEPGTPGSGVTYESKVSVDKIKQKYQNEIERTIPLALKQGILGWEVTDIKITMIDGEDHTVHSNPGDFIIATNMAVMEGLKNCGTTLLEPLHKFRITAPEEFSGKLIGELVNMGGEFESPEIINEKIIISGTLPVSTSMDFPIKLASLTSGKGKMTTSFHGYAPCTLEQGKTREYRGVNPLDRSKYILFMRNAL